MTPGQRATIQASRPVERAPSPAPRPADAMVIYAGRRYRLWAGRVVAVSRGDGRTEILAWDAVPLPVARAFRLGRAARRLAA